VNRLFDLLGCCHQLNSIQALSAAMTLAGALLRQENSQRKILDHILAFIRRKAMNGEQDFVDGLADRHRVTDQKDTRHALASRYSGISETWNRSAIVGEENSALCCGPIENAGVRRGRQADVSHVQDPQARIAPGQAVQDVPVEVLIDQEPDYRLRPFA
jgi:hypothetical protein